MASFWNQLSFFLLLVLVISPQIQAREGKLFSLFSHFRTIYNVKDPLDKTNAESPALPPGPTPKPASAPELEPESAPTPAPSAEQEIGSTIPSGPAPEPEFFDSGEGYGLYGRGSYSQYPPTKETPTTTTTFQNELLNEDFNDESYKTGYPKTNLYNNNNEEYKNNDNTKEEYRNSYIGGYSDDFNRYSNNNNNNNNGKENYNNNYNGKENYYNNNDNYISNGYEEKREGMSDTRFLENGKYYYHVNSVKENYNLNGYESGRGSATENEGNYYEKSQYPNEFDTMEEYEKQQEEQGYTP
ncbi:hypothetical protein JHK87_037594 [Glycine soja]|nr:hypothetical protein JHK87_037594 [Glycine soja]